ncbi:MAG: hypothetical protein H5T83_12765, partial [Actinotalea sp.]|nr:hypothetical protein [Actinotalea sp.]
MGDTTLHVLTGWGPAPADLVTEDGALTFSVPLPPDAPAPVPSPSTQGSPTQGSPASAPPAILLAGPGGTRAEVLADGTAVLRETSGAVVVGVVADGARLHATGDGVVEVVRLPRTDGADGAAGRAARVVVGGEPVLSAEWADRGDEGGLSLVVVPRPWVRTAGAAGAEAVWSALGRRTALGTDA